MVFVEFCCHSLRGECGLKSGAQTFWVWHNTSLSARRVWIEIESVISFSGSCIVTLCEESVDWNTSAHIIPNHRHCHSLRGECGLKFIWGGWQIRLQWSLSARRVWIEIRMSFANCHTSLVTLCEESVDWNRLWVLHWLSASCHSLRGECGLKFIFYCSSPAVKGHSLRGECGLKFSRL